MKMIDQREVVFQTTGHGARDFKKNNVTSKEIEKIISFCIQKSVDKLSKISMPNIEKYGLDATLYLVKVDQVARAIVSIDDDALFNQEIITLYAFSRDHDIKKMIRNTSESFFQEIKSYLESEVNRYAD